jgi:aminoglycoside/choline kinase family phosphotransferase
MIDDTKLRALSSLYETYCGKLPSKIVCLKGDGSNREVYRIYSENQKTVIGVYGPNACENEAFVSFSQSFYGINLPVPQILSYDRSNNIYIEDDLGDTTLFEWYQALSPLDKMTKVAKTYKQVLARLVQFQIDGDRVIDYSKCYQFPAFDENAIQFDLDYFRNSFLNRFVRGDIDEHSLNEDFSTLIQRLISAKADYFLYRDFQSRNIMLHDGQLFFIDYQSGRKGALQYDLASLLFDANLRLDNSLRDSLLHHYIELISQHVSINVKEFKDLYFDFVLVRMLQALAAFSHLALDKQKMYFLDNIPLALENVATLFQKNCLINELPELKRLFIDDLLKNPKISSKGV